ncbi:hypothetical protein F511_25060 [Dorcoceras hygrometricum]|uniref:Uncharacterized protein n=1 Tax=Dorcoceras hygrometricum TaxID=472368 RepID=A0A2Z7ANQ5_9LAMI|nr:hypothetical protein F511_25060 [Dorcoceras hygrometricum]
MLTWISVVGVLARIQLLRVISCWYVSCDDQQRALRDFEAMTFCEQEPAVGFLLSVLGFNPEVPLGCCFCLPVCCSGFPGFAAGRGYNPAGGAPGGG